MRKFKKRFKFSLILGFLAGIVALAFWATPDNKPARAIPAHVSTTTTISVSRLPRQLTAQERVKLGTVHHRKGPEHGLIKQLVAEPEYWGFMGDARDTKKVRKWAEREAHLDWTGVGKIDRKFGEEFRVRHADEVAYVLQKVGNRKQIVQVLVSGENAGLTQEVRSVDPDYLHAKFIGYPGSKSFRSPYEYIDTGSTG